MWSTDITYIPTKEGTLYECLIRDKQNGAIVASKTSRYFTADLLKDMTIAALLLQKIEPGQLTIHSTMVVNMHQTYLLNYLKSIK